MIFIHCLAYLPIVQKYNLVRERIRFAPYESNSYLQEMYITSSDVCSNVVNAPLGTYIQRNRFIRVSMTDNAIFV